ncbi:MAG: EamA family transporter [Oscillospiraceae bacterium]|nr:EamA family transporter [Oscillospiraceae bacterium]
MNKKISVLCIIASGCLWGTLGIFVRDFSEYGISSMTVVFLRSVLTALFTMGAMALFRRDELKIKLRHLWIFAGMGLLSIVFFNFCYFTAVTLMPLSAAAILLYTSPVFVMLLSALFFKERITRRKLLSAGIAIIGLVLVTGVIGDAAAITPSGILYGLGSAFGYALYSIFSRAAINRGYSALTVTGWAFTFSALFSAAAADMNALGNMLAVKPSMGIYAAVFAIVASVLPYLLYSLGLKGTDNSTAAVIASVEPVAATLFGMILYGEIPSLSAAAGIILVISALAVSVCEGPAAKDTQTDC